MNRFLGWCFLCGSVVASISGSAYAGGVLLIISVIYFAKADILAAIKETK